MGPDVPSPPGDSDRSPATVAVDSHRSGCGGQVQVPCRVCGAQVPRHPQKGPLYYSLSTAGTVPVELFPALKTHLREHHGDLALLAPHGLATRPPPPPRVLAPNVKPGISFHDVPALATLRGTIAAVDAGTTLAGMRRRRSRWR